MKRLLAQIGMTYFSVLVAAFYLSDTITMICGAVFALIAAVFLIVRRFRKTIFLPLMALAATIACAVNLGYTFFFVQPTVERYSGNRHTVQAVLTDEVYRYYSKYYYRLKTVSIDGEAEEVKLLLKTSERLGADPDDMLTFRADIEAVENDYNRAKGFFLQSDDCDIGVTVQKAETHTLYYQAIRLRRFFRKTIESLLPRDSADLCRAVLIGDKYALDLSARQKFRYAGASYFIVVSGMHFAVITMLIYRILRRTPLPGAVRLILILSVMLLYAAVTGFQPTVMRSGIMMAVAVIGMTIRRKAYPLNHLGIAGLLLPCFVSPYGAGDTGLILSYYATFAILLWANPIMDRISVKNPFGETDRLDIAGRFLRLCKRSFDVVRRKKRNDRPDPVEPFTLKVLLRRFWNSIAAVLSVSLAANIMVVPISVCIFREFSVVTVLSAVILYCEIYLILVLALAVCLLFWFKPLAVLLSWPLYWLCELVLWIVSVLGGTWAHFRVTDRFFLIWLLLTIILGAIVILYRERYRCIKLAAFGSAMIFIGGAVTHGMMQSQVLSLEVYSCGNGLCAGVNAGGDLHLLSMDASYEQLYPLWRELSRRYDGAHSALCCDAVNLRNYQLYDDEFAIFPIMLYDSDSSRSTDDDILRFSGDSDFQCDDDLTVSVTTKNQKAVPYVTAGDKTILLIPKGSTLADIPAENRTADVIVICEAFAGMDELSCEYLIVSAQDRNADGIAYVMQQRCDKICFTAEGDITLSLR